MKRTWVYVNGELIPKEEYSPEPQVYVRGDYEAYKSMATGEMVQGRAQHREHLKRHDLIELGNEKVQPPKPIPVAPGLKETIARVVYEKLSYR